jgi:hypothetical protein
MNAIIIVEMRIPRYYGTMWVERPRLRVGNRRTYLRAAAGEA